METDKKTKMKKYKVPKRVLKGYEHFLEYYLNNKLGVVCASTSNVFYKADGEVLFVELSITKSVHDEKQKTNKWKLR